MSSEKLEVRYTCGACGVHDQAVEVDYRHADMDVVTWIETRCMTMIARDHAQRSPWCRATSVQDIKIPIPPGTQFVGGPVQQ